MDVVVLSRAGRPILARPVADSGTGTAIKTPKSSLPSDAPGWSPGRDREASLASTCASVQAMLAYTSDVMASMRDGGGGEKVGGRRVARGAARNQFLTRVVASELRASLVGSRQTTVLETVPAEGKYWSSRKDSTFVFLTKGSLHLFGSEIRFDQKESEKEGDALKDSSFKNQYNNFLSTLPRFGRSRYSFHFLTSVLEAAYRQILFTLTDQVHAIFYKSSGRFDVRSRLLGGAPDVGDGRANASRTTLRPVQYILNGAEGEWDNNKMDRRTEEQIKILEENDASLSLSAGCHLLCGVATLPLPPSVRANATRALAAGISSHAADMGTMSTGTSDGGNTLAALLVVTKDDHMSHKKAWKGAEGISHCRLVSVVFPHRPRHPSFSPQKSSSWKRSKEKSPSNSVDNNYENDSMVPPMESSDVGALMNFVQSQPGLRANKSEVWMPICLPTIGSTGYVHAYYTGLSTALLTMHKYKNCDIVDNDKKNNKHEFVGMDKWLSQGLGLSLLLISDSGELNQFLKFRVSAAAVRKALGLTEPANEQMVVAKITQTPSTQQKSPGQKHPSANSLPRGKKFSSSYSRRGSWTVEGILEATAADLASPIALKYCDAVACHHFLYRCDVVMTSTPSLVSSHATTAPSLPSDTPEAVGQRRRVLTQVLTPPAGRRFASRKARRTIWGAYERCAARLRVGSSDVVFREALESKGDATDVNRLTVQELMGLHPGVHSVTYIFEDGAKHLVVGMCGPRFELYACLPGKLSVREGLNLCSQLVFRLKADERDLFFVTPYVRRL
mmetsp:Transcript_13343/g.29419  ORF Transcript_13343/g.29419 Transcript_13343/m.29419 type:complete len:788 (-) Transcript_13343:189-2552(-)